MRRIAVVIIAAVGASMFLGLGIKSVYGATILTKTTSQTSGASSRLSNILPPPPDPSPRTKYLPK